MRTEVYLPRAACKSILYMGVEPLFQGSPYIKVRKLDSVTFRKDGVITSYSIHYTKLYEVMMDRFTVPHILRTL